MRALILATLITTAFSTVAQSADFTQYPGFRDKDALIEMTTDKGLIVEYVLRCNRKGRAQSGIMTYSKVERLFCSSKNRCTPNAITAAEDTCGF